MGGLATALVKSTRMTTGRVRARAQTQTPAGQREVVMQVELGGSVPREHGWGGVGACISLVGLTCLFPHRGDDDRRVCNSLVRVWKPLRTPPRPLPLSLPLPPLLVVVQVGSPHLGGEAAIVTG